ncbi:MAG TPA: helix-turn-helix domain-containing protein, partial [Paenibacillus sp.]|nr:helix-turn-helix domain-containing protein [Paenibacillus sp.]
VEESVRHILRERERYRLMTDMNAQLSQSLPLLREKFWLRAIRDGIEPTGNLGEQLSFLGIDLALAGKYCVFVIGVDDWSAVLESMSERDRQLISFALLNISQEIVDRTYRGYAFEHRQGEFVCVLALSTEADEDGLYATLNEIRQTVADLLKLSVTIGIGRPVSELRQLPSSYDMAMEALGQKLILGKNRIIMIDRVQDDADPYYRLHPQQVAQLTSCVRAGNAEQTARLLDALYEELIGRPQSTLRHFQKLYLQLLLIGSNALIGTSGYGDDPSTDENRLWAELSKLETAEDMHRLLIDYFMRACEIGREKRNDKSRSVIEDIKRIVEEQYGDPELTIQRIADRIYLTSTYVSLIFKQETGQTVNEYLTHVRMEHAKRLLTQTRNKLYDISEAVGYTDGSYFTKQFKKQTGLTPKEFRERPI